MSTFPGESQTTGGSSAITRSSATVAGVVNPHGAVTSYHFDYGFTTGYDATTPAQSAGSGTTAVNLTGNLSGLVAGTTYHYRLVATTPTGSAVGTDHTFTTVTPVIAGVSFTGTPANPTVTISGNFGAEPSASPATPLNCVVGDTSYDFGATGLWFTDTPSGWTAGQIGDCVGLVVTSFSTTQVVYGFGADYGAFTSLADGAAYRLEVDGVTFSGTVSGL